MHFTWTVAAPRYMPSPRTVNVTGLAMWNATGLPIKNTPTPSTVPEHTLHLDSTNTGEHAQPTHEERDQYSYVVRDQLSHEGHDRHALPVEEPPPLGPGRTSRKTHTAPPQSSKPALRTCPHISIYITGLQMLIKYFYFE